MKLDPVEGMTNGEKFPNYDGNGSLEGKTKRDKP